MKSKQKVENDHFYRHKKKNGKVIKVKLRGSLISYLGRRAELVCVMDITDNIEYQEKLLANESKFKSLIENIKDMIVIVDKDANYKYVASSSNSILGYGPEHYLGRSAYDFINKKDLKLLQKVHKKILSTNQVSFGPYRFPDSDGNWRWLKTELTNHLNTENINGIIANTRDVTEEIQKKFRTELISTLTKALSSPGSLQEALSLALTEITQASKFEVSEFWLVGEYGTSLNLVAKYANSEIAINFHKESEGETDLQKGIGLPGNVWLFNKVLIWENLGKKVEFTRFKEANKFGLNTAIGIPILYGEEFLGCFVGITTKTEKRMDSHLDFINEIAQEVGPIIKQRITEEEHRNFFNLTPDPHCLITFKGLIKKCNDALSTSTGFNFEELRTLSFSGLIHPCDISKVQTIFEQFKRDQIPKTSFEARIKTKSGAYKWVLWSISLWKESKLLLVVGKDISENKEYELKLAMQNERFEMAIKATHDIIWEINHKTGELTRSEINESQQPFSLFEQFSENNSLFSKVLEKDRKRVWESFLKALKDPDQHFWTEEYNLTSKKGELLYIMDRCYIRRDNDGTPLRTIGSMSDITVLKKQLERIERQNEKLKEIAWLQSHVIRAPLAKILGLIQLHKETKEESLNEGEIFELIRSSAAELDKVIREISEKTNEVEKSLKH
ncbi:PAS domain S-box protein [Luteibaculum oceani]|uniref:histidine kinase n=1 Tax=Luteibaculum oceani TaxID=1294296 RepID=A0A5C6UUP6_9FLAO|nr:PAS domain S-box protein [Luteibaculum oceani]